MTFWNGTRSRFMSSSFVAVMEEISSCESIKCRLMPGEVLERVHHVLLLVALCGRRDELCRLLGVGAKRARVVADIGDRRS